MNKNIFKTLLVSFIVLFSAIFINIGGVKADKVTNGNKEGYATCYYQWDESKVDNAADINYSGSDAVSLGTSFRPYKLGITMYKGKDGHFYGWAEVGCSEKNADGTFGKKTTGTCYIDNYNAKFGNIDLNMDICNFLNYDGKYSGNSLDYGSCNKAKKGQIATTWICPDKIYLNKDNQNDRMSLFFTKTSCDAANNPWGCSYTIKLSSDKTRQSGYPKKLTVNNYTTSNKDTQSQTASDQLNSITEGNSDYTQILKWGENSKEGEYSFDDVGSECNSISEIAELLTTILWIVDIIAIIVLIIMTAVDLVRAIIGSEEDTLKSAFKHLIIRIIVVFILLLLPILLGTIISIINTEAGTVQIGDDGKPFCDVGN